jgi:hypothetical protein
MTSSKNINIEFVSLREPSVVIEYKDPKLSLTKLRNIMKEYGSLQQVKFYNHDSNKEYLSAVVDFNMWNNDFITKNLRINLLAGDSEFLIYDYKKGYKLTFKALTQVSKPSNNHTKTPVYSLDTVGIYDRHHR